MESKKPHPNTPKRNPAQKMEDRAFIARCALRGMTLAETATALGKVRDYTLSIPVIWGDLKKAKQDWQKAAVEDIDAAKARALASLDEQERELWSAWEASKEKKTKTRVDGAPTQNGGVTPARVQKATEERTGDPRYMALILAVQEARAKLLGTAAPTKLQLAGKLDGPPALAITFQGVDMGTIDNPYEAGNNG